MDSFIFGATTVPYVYIVRRIFLWYGTLASSFDSLSTKDCEVGSTGSFPISSFEAVNKKKKDSSFQSQKKVCSGIVYKIMAALSNDISSYRERSFDN